MKKIIIKVVVFIALFCTTAFFVNKLNNLNINKATREMQEATLPVVYCQYNDETINRLCGYTNPMSTCLMRESIVPLNEGYGVNLLVDDEHGFGASYAYELRTISGDSLVENGDLEPKGMDGAKQQFFVRFRMDMQENQEYVLVFIIKKDEEKVARYYTRVVNLEEEHIAEFMDFAYKFHETSFDKNVTESEGNFVSELLRPTGEGQSYNLSHVTLNANYDMVSFANLDPVIVSSTVPRITELDSEYGIVNYSYVVQSNQNGNNHYYNVDEYYSLLFDKYTKEIKILGFDRYMDSYFDEAYVSKARNAISVGISKDDVEFLTTEDNKKLAFVKAGTLWYYDYKNNSLTNIFGFTQNNFNDSRNVNTQVDINIAGMDDDGNIYFVVYGYMNRGAHEGENGVSLYYYDSATSEIVEKIFVSSDEPFDVMRTEIGRFTYYDKHGHLYYLLDGAVYAIDIQNMTQDLVVTGLTSDKIQVSSSRNVIAYPENDTDEDIQKIIVRNFDENNVYEESCSSGERLNALGFIQNDLIYGVANKSDVLISDYGETILPLKKLCIVEPGGKTLKEYQKPELYVMDTVVEGEKIYLTRAAKQNNFFTTVEPDIISFKLKKDENNVNTAYSYSDNAMNVLDMVFPSDIYISESTKLIMTKSKDAEIYKDFDIKTQTRDGSYYVFNDDGYVGEYKSAGKAIMSIGQLGTGLVVDENGNTIYRALAATGYNTVADSIKEYACNKKKDSLMACAFMCINYENKEISYEDVAKFKTWEEAFDKLTNGVGINISGIDLQTALYFLDRDIPFVAAIDDGRYVLVISYNSTHIRYYDPVEGEEVRVTRSEFEKLLTMQSNTMYTYTSQ